MKNKILTISILSLLTALTACGGGGGGSSSGNNNSGDGGSNSNGGNNSNFTYFIPFSDNGSGLWKTNGTSNGSSKIADVKNNTQFVVLDDTVFYIEELDSNKSTPIQNGVNNSVLKRIKNGVTTTIHGDESQIRHLTRAGKYIYFSELIKLAFNSYEMKLWVTDGSSSPKVIPNSPTLTGLSLDGFGAQFFPVGDSIYYVSSGKLYLSNINETEDISNGLSVAKNAKNNTIIDGNLYFIASTQNIDVFKVNGKNAEKLSTLTGSIDSTELVFLNKVPHLLQNSYGTKYLFDTTDNSSASLPFDIQPNIKFIRDLILLTNPIGYSNRAMAYKFVDSDYEEYTIYDDSTEILDYAYINDTIIMEDATNIIATNLDGKFVKIDSNCGKDIRDIVGYDSNNIYFMKDYKLYKSAGLKVVNGNASFTCELLKDDTHNMPSER